MDEHREGIQANKPIPLGDHREGIQADKPIPPWERPGCFRMDCEPHRGTFLWWLACASYILGLLALLPCVGFWFGVVGVPFNLCSRYLTKADLTKMRAGLMDPAGEEHTSQARRLSTLGLRFSIVGTFLWGGACLLSAWLDTRSSPR
jgi:hypothetical protein